MKVRNEILQFISVAQQGNCYCFGLSRMEGVWERDGNGVGAGTGTPFRDKPPPPPPVVSKGCVY